MVRISNKPNVRGIKNVSEDVNYRATLIGKEGRLFSALIYTRVKGMGMGIAFAALIFVIIPFLAKLCGF